MVTSFELVSASLQLRHPHRLFLTRDVFAPDNDTLADVLQPLEPEERVRVWVVVDEGVTQASPALLARLEQWFAARTDRMELAAAPLRLAGGEDAKNDFRRLEALWRAINEARLCRHSYIVAIGGGALLDLVGFAAATAHRGIPLVRLPTTSLSQGDGGIGVKNGVNLFGKKNWLGAFTVPHAVINDSQFLHLLPPRERRAGLIEALKVALIRNATFFRTIETQAEELATFAPEPFEAVIQQSAREHLQHIATGGDPFERGSARPLDFGHWSAHKLEQLSDFRLSHAEAVAVGMALDLVYAVRVRLLAPEVGDRLLALIERLGFATYAAELDLRDAQGRRRVIEGLDEFREHMGGRLTIPMIRQPGDRIDLHEMDVVQVEAAIDHLRARHG